MIRRRLFNIFPFLLAVLIFFIIHTAGQYPFFIEAYYSKGFYLFIAPVISFFTSSIPFSVWDIFWILIVILLIIVIGLIFFQKIKLSKAVLRFFQAIALIYSWFYLVWGFNYFRPKIEERMGWTSFEPDEEVFRENFDSLITRTNKSYTDIASSDYKLIDSLIEKSYAENAVNLQITYPNGFRRPKNMLLSSFFAKSGVSGYFGPFFNEVHVNKLVLPIEYPFVLAHEKAHQFGITEEAEANLASFIICSSSFDNRLRYSGNLQLLTYFLADAHRLDDRQIYVNKIDSLVKKDILLQRNHWRQLENKTLDRVQTAANNAYLKTNRIKDGVKNYNRVVSLLINWNLHQSKNKTR